MSHRTLISSIVLYKEASSLRYIYLRAGVDITAVLQLIVYGFGVV